MESYIVNYLAAHPESLILAVAVAYWVRREFIEKNKSGDREEFLQSCADMKKLLLEGQAEIKRGLDDGAHDRSRFHEAIERVEGKIDEGLICPLQRKRVWDTPSP